MNKRGFEKPIEIFVALFIILAVALVLLKLFQNQISEKQKQLADVQQEQEAREMMEKVQLSCQDKCVQASNNGCGIASLASLCIHNSQNILEPDDFIDLNNDRLKNYDTSFLAGVGVCEERLYCFHVIESCCNREISPRSCKEILRTYWERAGLVNDSSSFDARLAQVAPAKDAGSSCTPDSNLWSALENWGTA